VRKLGLLARRGFRPTPWLQVAVLGDARLIEQLERERGTEVRRVGPLPERPDELLVRVTSSTWTDFAQSCFDLPDVEVV